jgi:hypothetical protein
MCADCHTAHRELPADDPTSSVNRANIARTCAACHAGIYDIWTKTPSRHAKVNCAACHTRHGFIPQCTDCHGLPHSKPLHERFPKCLTCHQDAHNPPVRQR